MTVRTATAALTSMVARLRGRSFDELRVRSTQALYAGLERFWPGSPLRVSASVRIPEHDLFAGSLQLLAAGGADPGTVARRAAQEDPESAARFTQQADALEHGMLALLGYPPLCVGNPPRWHREALTGTEAPRTHWSRINHLDPSVVGDHKLLWELNRHQYLLAPAFCWLLEQQVHRFDLIQLHLESWLEENPPRWGVNWASSLEVAYRAISWCWLLSILREAPWRPHLRQRLAASLEAHARHIERYLSTYFSPNTHLTGEALGLFYVGSVLRPSRQTQRWRAKGASILESSLERQVYADGVYFEQATQYQRYTADIYLHFLVLAQASGRPVPDATRARLVDLLLVLRTVASGTGIIPLLGDDDGGLLLPLDHRAPDDVRALLLAAGAALQRPDLCSSVPAPPGAAYWLCGIESTDRARAEPAAAPDWCDLYFACGGLAVMRDGWNADSAVAVIDAGPHGALSCGHSHADALAMTLTLGPTPLFIDRGTLTYTGPERNEFRATLSHNTLEIDELSSVAPGLEFKWLPGIPARASGLVSCAADLTGFIGVATGHVAGGRPSAHCRRVLHQRGGAWLVHDVGVRPQARTGTLRWQLAPGLSVSPLDAHSMAIRNASGSGVAMVLLLGASNSRIVTREVSPRFGQRTGAQCLELSLDASLEILTIVLPAAADGTLGAFELHESQARRDVAWSDAGGEHHVSIGPVEEAAGLPPEIVRDAELVWRVTSGTDGHRDERLGVMPAFRPEIPADEQVRTNLPAESGTMTFWAKTSGLWRQLRAAQPRRG